MASQRGRGARQTRPSLRDGQQITLPSAEDEQAVRALTEALTNEIARIDKDLMLLLAREHVGDADDDVFTGEQRRAMEGLLEAFPFPLDPGNDADDLPDGPGKRRAPQPPRRAKRPKVEEAPAAPAPAPRFAVLDCVDEKHAFYGKAAEGAFSSAASRAISKEWRIMADCIPERVYFCGFADRVDLHRFLVIGAPQTIYCNSYFLFDVRLPHDYPARAPELFFHAHNTLVHNSLHPDGAVCLSLLGTIPVADPRQAWQPGTSTLLQVVTSVQGLVLGARDEDNAAFTETEYLLRSLRVLVATVRAPPPEFAADIRAHFAASCRDTLAFVTALAKGRADRALFDQFGVHEALRKHLGYMGAHAKQLLPDLEALVREHGPREDKD